MTDNHDNLNQLLEKLELLMKRQEDFSKDINSLKVEIAKLKSESFDFIPVPEQKVIVQPVVQTSSIEKQETDVSEKQVLKPQAERIDTTYSSPTLNQPPTSKSNLEKFIGENLINKIGIVITILGVGIGAKYAIDHQLISPLTRIILGYMFGGGLLGVALKLKKNYKGFSAVLLSGAMAILYFITFAAYSFYELIPQVLAFGLMAIFTFFTVAAAISYNRVVIAHIGLVGAYAVPFLLSDGSGKVGVLFTYMAIINVGILVIAFKKYWKSLFYVAFGLTWLMYVAWYGFSYRASEHFGLGLTFLFVFFVIFYVTFLAYKLIRSEKFQIEDIAVLLLNAFVFYGVGYDLLEGNETGVQLLGVFTLFNAVVHFIVSVILYRQNLADRNLFYLIAGIVLLFITITIPVQLDGNWVSLLWAGEAALLFWIGRTKQMPFYEKLSYIMMMLAFVSLCHDWSVGYGRYYPGAPETRITPLLNANLLTSILFVAIFGFINFVNQSKKYVSLFVVESGILKFVSFLAPSILLVVLYYAFQLEIDNYWNQLYVDSELQITMPDNDYPQYFWNYDLLNFKTIWIINYSLFFLSVLAFLNLEKLQNHMLGLINLGLIILNIAIFLLVGLYDISDLRDSYLSESLSQNYQTGSMNLWIRYISMGFVTLAIIAFYKSIGQSFIRFDFKLIFDAALYISILWIASSELINWMDIAQSTHSYKLALSILWGVYSLLLIMLGIWKAKKHLRIGAIVLFGITLLKLFFYDISHLNTISKTILFVSLGVLLLIISFLYNKYKHLISDEATN
jgi:uncharacterized membrane protein